MQKHSIRLPLAALSTIVAIGLFSAHAQESAPATAIVPVQMTTTVQLLGDDSSKTMPEVKKEDVVVRQAKNRLRVLDWTPARGDHDDLSLFILIDDASGSGLGSQLDDLRAFINGLAPGASVGVGYMRNATVQIVQNFTTDHALAAKSVRLPMSSAGAYGSPYLSLIDLMKRWPPQPKRREVLMITDGVDRARGGPRYPNSTNPDATSASAVAQRTGTIVHTIFARGVGRAGNNYWEINGGQNNMAMLSDETGGESYFLGMQNPVSFKPYLDSLQKTLDRQYLLRFAAIPGKKSQLQYVKLTTEVAGVEIDSADAVWVEAAPK
jgi:hypothetical protein